MANIFTRRGFLKSSAVLPTALTLNNLTSGVSASANDANITVRRIVPPNLDAMHLGKRILCYRPMRRGAPNMSVQQLGSQTLVHNYGHGGSGWTLAPGSAAYVVDLAEQTPQRKGKAEPVIVIGAGVMALFTAYELVNRGYKNVKIIADRFDGLTSHNAGGLLAPVSMDNEPRMQAVIDRIGVDAYRFYASVAKKTHSHFSGGAVLIPAYFERRNDSGLEPYVGIVMKPAQDVILDFGNGTRRPMVSYDDGIFIDTAVFMKSLKNFLSAHVRIEQRKVKNYSDLSANLVFDCAGMGSGLLNRDADMVSVQGHLIMLKDQQPQNLQHMILVYFDDGKTEVGQKVKRSFYIFPKHLPGSKANDVGVVGGTFIEGATAATPNLNEFSRMIEGAKRFYGI